MKKSFKKYFSFLILFIIILGVLIFQETSEVRATISNTTPKPIEDTKPPIDLPPLTDFDTCEGLEQNKCTSDKWCFTGGKNGHCKWLGSCWCIADSDLYTPTPTPELTPTPTPGPTPKPSGCKALSKEECTKVPPPECTFENKACNRNEPGKCIWAELGDFKECICVSETPEPNKCGNQIVEQGEECECQDCSKNCEDGCGKGVDCISCRCEAKI